VIKYRKKMVEEGPGCGGRKNKKMGATEAHGKAEKKVTLRGKGKKVEGLGRLIRSSTRERC